MTWLKRKLESLQSKPYQVRIRYLWTGVTVAALFIIAIWFVSLALRDKQTSEAADYSGFREIWENAKRIKLTK